MMIRCFLKGEGNYFAISCTQFSVEQTDQKNVSAMTLQSINHCVLRMEPPEAIKHVLFSK